MEQKNEITITNEENITLTLGDFEVKDPDSDLLTLIVGEGENYIVAGNVITPVADFVGDLTVPVQVDDGLQLSDVFNATVRVVNVVGSAEGVQGLKVYPNPASDRIYIEHANQNEFRILLMDQFGKVIQKDNASFVNDFSVDLSRVSAGLYLLKVQTTTET
ncbi:MAG TPA: T9SS type A sorting domain-containing protein, partial [Flavitalea sp.]|nr:T9SS type A sorting domain-containing protein [Flavitalea sp.]